MQFIVFLICHLIRHFEYLNHKVLSDNRKCLYREPYLINSYPDSLSKKVLLLQKFKKFMSENLVCVIVVLPTYDDG